MLLVYFIFLAVDYLSAASAYLFEREDKKLLWWLFLQRFFYRQLLYYTAMRSVLAALLGWWVGWMKLDRSASVAAATEPVRPRDLPRPRLIGRRSLVGLARQRALVPIEIRRGSA